MQIKRKFTKHKSAAQGMVEFALVLPILMMLVFGLLEVGRMVFVYMTVITASREAVRYGSATGENISSSSLRYADCAGIRKAAYNVDFLKVFKSVNIWYYDNASLEKGNCQNSTPPISIETGYRIKVEVVGSFTPIVSIIPLENHDFVSENYHTLLGTVSIERAWEGIGGPGGGGPGGGGPGGGGGGVDQCLNIDGLQETVPVGMYKDLDSNCHPLEDLCTNIDGIQNPIPNGYQQDAGSNPPTCSPIPPPPDTFCHKIISTKPDINNNYTSIVWKIQNGSSNPIPINNIHVSWPDGTGGFGVGNLTGVDLKGVLLIDPSIDPPKAPPSLDIPVSIDLATGESTLTFTFSNTPLSGPFSVGMSFGSVGGITCVPQFGSVNVYPVTHSGSISDPTGKIAGPWSIFNHTLDPLHIQEVKITWHNKVNCQQASSLHGVSIGSSQTWLNTSIHNSDSCNGFYLSTVVPNISTWVLPVNSSDLNLTFSRNAETGIIVTIYVMGTQNYVSYIIDSSNQLQVMTNP